MENEHRNTKCDKVRRNWRRYIVFFILAFFLDHIFHRLSDLLMVDRQIFGEVRRSIFGSPSAEFHSIYETPHFRQINLNTKTNELPKCEWLEGKRERERERERERKEKKEQVARQTDRQTESTQRVRVTKNTKFSYFRAAVVFAR